MEKNGRGPQVFPSPLLQGIGIDFSGISEQYMIFPGFCDVHVHLREPGFSYKETIASGTAAAAAGGYTAICAMPNLNPVPDSVEHLAEELKRIRLDARVRVFPYGALTVGEKGETAADLEGMAQEAIAFSDDGRGVQSESMMRAVMERAKRLGKIVAAHCEVNSLLHGGYIHAGSYAAAHGHRGICSESEWREIERDVRLSKETGCAFHVCHISCRESVDIIRRAKAEGIDVTCETAPHYLILDENDLQEDGRFKMNPPLRSKEDREALLNGVLDGTVDMIATDHAPHSAAEKAAGLEKSAFGITGLETAFPMLYTYLVKPGLVPLDRIITMLTEAPRKRFNIPYDREYTVWDLQADDCVNPSRFLSMGKATPFALRSTAARCMLTVCGGRTVYRAENLFREDVR